MKKISALIMTAAVAFTLAACSTTTTQAPSLAGKTFTGSFVGETGESQSITFTEEGRVFGFSGCNRFNGAYVQQGSKLSMDKVAMTRMMCSPQANAAESTFIDSVNKTVEFAESEDGIVLIGADGAQLAKLVLKK